MEVSRRLDGIVTGFTWLRAISIGTQERRQDGGDVWTQTHFLREQGRGREPFWPKVNLLPEEREGHRFEHFYVLYVEEGSKEEQSLKVEESQWRQLKEGDKLRLPDPRWGMTQTRTRSAQGPEDRTPRQPELQAGEQGSWSYTTYILHLRDDNGLGYSTPVSEEQWHRLTPGSRCTVVFNYGKFARVE
ncbi:hypothetical protein F0U61_05590 [Archangium violaceum]|uniref:hypothetical protein n=1 Tax=Archangium violaceum TaxID=83451 RepID=UPI002B2D77F1|nr:hypothetical protein F0U61_05590 [Archangium violaceum]